VVSQVIRSMHSTWFLILFFNKRNQNSLEKCLILGLEPKICKINLEHLVVPEGKEMHKTKQNNGSVSKKHN
jgi:hypothetical protein